MIGKNCLEYFSRKQTCTAQSTSEAEYIAMSEVCKSITRFIRIMRELEIPHKKVTVHCDNQPALFWSDGGYTKLPKHVDTRYYFVTDMVEDGRIKPMYIPSASNVADILTKPLPLDAHQQHCTSLGLQMWEEC